MTHIPVDETPSPWFSVVLSAYNRPKLLARCLDTILSQSFRDFEVVIVDDGSKDDTAEVGERTGDPRVRVVRHGVNRGLCAARDTGCRAAKGHWLIQLDSDHGLREGALENLHRRTREAPPEVGLVGSRYLWDTGVVTPAHVPEGVVDYAGRIRWVDAEGGTDYLACYRRELYGPVRWHADRRGPLDTLFQLDLARATKARYDADVIALEYSDATNSQTRSRGFKGARTLMSYAPDMAWQFDEILRVHGDALREHAPRTWMDLVRTAGMFHFIAGDRVGGARLLARYLSRAPTSKRGWGVLALGLVDRRLLAWARSQRA